MVNQINLKKKLLYQSTHRGCKELDIILGGFAEKFLMKLESKSTLDYQELLNAADNDIYDWITKKKIPPTKYNTEILREIISYNTKQHEKKL